MLVTLNDMKAYLGISLSDTTYDAFLTTQITIVSEAIEGYCNRKFAQATYTQTFYKEDLSNKTLREIDLYHFPLVSISSLTEKQGASGSPVNVTDYRFNLPTAILTKNFGTFFRDGDILEVNYSAGYSTIPALVTSVVYSVVEERYNKKVNGIDLNFGSDVQRISIPGTISIDFDYTLSNNERKSTYGVILGNNLNILDSFRSERTLVGSRISYVS